MLIFWCFFYRVFPRHMEKIFVLTLKDLLTADAGNYTCIANNSTAKSIKSVVLDVVGEMYFNFKMQMVLKIEMLNKYFNISHIHLFLLTLLFYLFLFRQSCPWFWRLFHRSIDHAVYILTYIYIAWTFLSCSCFYLIFAQ